MRWLAANWFWVLIFVAFFWMHAVGHGSHGGHGGRRGAAPEPSEGNEAGDRKDQDAPSGSGGHRH